MRGAVSVALVYAYYDPHGTTTDRPRSTLISMTLTVVLISTLVFGAVTKPLLDYLLGSRGEKIRLFWVSHLLAESKRGDEQVLLETGLIAVRDCSSAHHPQALEVEYHQDVLACCSLWASTEMLQVMTTKPPRLVVTSSSLAPHSCSPSSLQTSVELRRPSLAGMDTFQSSSRRPRLARRRTAAARRRPHPRTAGTSLNGQNACQRDESSKSAPTVLVGLLPHKPIRECFEVLYRNGSSLTELAKFTSGGPILAGCLLVFRSISISLGCNDMTNL